MMPWMIQVFLFSFSLMLSVNMLLFEIITLVSECISNRTQDDSLVFDRNPWWKRLLAMDDLPLSLWSLFLEKADTWKCDASHSHLDVLYFLLREKNTLLLQNVRRRRIRKRKRYGF